MLAHVRGDVVFDAVDREFCVGNPVSESASHSCRWKSPEINVQRIRSSNDVYGLSIPIGRLNFGDNGSVSDDLDDHAVGIAQSELVYVRTVFEGSEVFFFKAIGLCIS